MKTLQRLTVGIALTGMALAQAAAAPSPSSQASAPSAQSATQRATPPTPPPPPKDTAKPGDVKTIEALTAALYDVISGPSGPRNWDRFRSLFAPDAHLTVTGKRPDGTAAFRILTAEDYISRSGPSLEKEGFFEHSIADKTESYGNIAQVFST